MIPTLVVLAAGIGNRYGGLKQMDAVGPAGETIMDYSIFDAVRAGFGKVVFVIRRSFESEFRAAVLRKLEGRIDVDCAFQEMEDLPAGYAVPAGRTKPWGTSHAVLAARGKVDAPFAAINADDFYGPASFREMAAFLGRRGRDEAAYSLIGYELESTLSDHGSVARGVCEVDGRGYLTGIVERTRIERSGGGIVYLDEAGAFRPYTGREIVSMNYWGFTPGYFGYAADAFARFLRERGSDPKAEMYIPLVVNELIRQGRATVEVLPSRERWFGVTYKDDKPKVVAELAAQTAAGKYPTPLWT